MKLRKLLLLATSLMLISGCTKNEFKGVKYSQDSEDPKITYINASETNKEFTVGDEPYVITYDIGGRNGVTNKNVVLSSGDNNIATISATTVENNPYAVKITPIGAGETSLYIASELNPEVKATIKVKVNELPADAGIISLTPLGVGENILNIGESVVVHVQNRNGNVEWSVEYGYDYFSLSEGSNESVKVTAVKAGTANVRATVNGAVARQSITVKPAPVQKTIYFIDTVGYSPVKLVKNDTTELESTSTDEFGHNIYAIEINESAFTSFYLSFNNTTTRTRSIACNEFVSKNAFKVQNSTSDTKEVELINFTAPTPYVYFGSDTFEIVNGYTESIHVVSFLGTVGYEIVDGADKISLNLGASNNEIVSITAIAVGTAHLKAKIVGSNPEISATIEVRVLTRPTPNDGGLPANGSTFTVNAEDVYEFSYSVFYLINEEEIACSVTWEITSGTSYASVSATATKVTISGLAEGTATLRATYDLNTKSRTYTITVNPVQNKTIYFTNNQNWSSVYVYAFKGDTKNHDWPGVKMENPVYNTLFEECYSFTFKSKLYDTVIFNNGGSEQTEDIAIASFTGYDNAWPSYKHDNKWIVGFAEFTAYASPTSTIYLNAGYGWNLHDAKIFVHCWKSDTLNFNVLMHWEKDDIYSCKIPSDYTGVIFVRNSPSVSVMVWDGDGYWGRTKGDLTFNSTKPQYNIDNYIDGQSDGHWSTKS